MRGIIELPAKSSAWYDLLLAADEAARLGQKVTLSLDQNGHGQTMMAVKVGEDMWSPHWRVETVA